MNILFEKEELKAIAQGDYSVFDHELSAYELKKAICQIVAELTSSEQILQMKAEVENLKGDIEVRDHRIHMAEKLIETRGESMAQLRKQIAEAQSAQKAAQKIFNEQRFEIHRKKEEIKQLSDVKDTVIDEKRKLTAEIEELKSTIHFRELALDEAAKKRDELETKNRQLCNDLAGERWTVRTLKEKIEALEETNAKLVSEIKTR